MKQSLNLRQLFYNNFKVQIKHLKDTMQMIFFFTQKSSLNSKSISQIPIPTQQACLYLFECISHGDSKYSHKIPEFLHFLKILVTFGTCRLLTKLPRG